MTLQLCVMTNRGQWCTPQCNNGVRAQSIESVSDAGHIFRSAQTVFQHLPVMLYHI